MTTVELLLVVVLLALVAAVAVPNFIRARTRPNLNACIVNLARIQEAKRSWALEQRKPPGAPADVAGIDAYFRNRTGPTCPAGGVYSYKPVGTAPTCSLGPTLGHTL